MTASASDNAKKSRLGITTATNMSPAFPADHRSTGLRVIDVSRDQHGHKMDGVTRAVTLL